MNDNCPEKELSRKQNHAGFTLIELLVSVATIGLLSAFLLPAVNRARETARRATCTNHIRQIGTAILNYESAHASFPTGGTTSQSGGFGFSWWVSILPYLEERAVFEKLDRTSEVLGYIDASLGNEWNHKLLNGKSFDVMACPSAPEGLLLNTVTMRPMYVGISGSILHSKTKPKKHTYAGSGTYSSGGILARYKKVHSRQIPSTSKTMMVAEQSDYCRRGSHSIDCLSDCSYGFAMGPAKRDWKHSKYSVVQSYDRGFNLTTLAYLPNHREFQSEGIAGNCSPNRPSLSAHPGGINAVFADGHVAFITDSIANVIWLRSADRNKNVRVNSIAKN
ncbi:MAG: DUF1559 domain-containing protein [Planctomycetales bacterium]|nr:DUF1559 domain-containing protein [Planctomycetales bacterium]